MRFHSLLSHGFTITFNILCVCVEMLLFFSVFRSSVYRVTIFFQVYYYVFVEMTAFAAANSENRSIEMRSAIFVYFESLLQRLLMLLLLFLLSFSFWPSFCCHCQLASDDFFFLSYFCAHILPILVISLLFEWRFFFCLWIFCMLALCSQ